MPSLTCPADALGHPFRPTPATSCEGPGGCLSPWRPNPRPTPSTKRRFLSLGTSLLLPSSLSPVRALPSSSPGERVFRYPRASLFDGSTTLFLASFGTLLSLVLPLSPSSGRASFALFSSSSRRIAKCRFSIFGICIVPLSSTRHTCTRIDVSPFFSLLEHLRVFVLSVLTRVLQPK